MALLAALSMVLVTAPGSTAAEEEGTKNLSTPVILVDDDAQSALFNAKTVPGAPTGHADYTVPGSGDLAGNYYTSKSSDNYTSTVDQEFDADLWGADWTFEDTDAVGALAKWGDNLVSAPLNGGKPVRVEVNLFADAAAAAKYGPMKGYPMVTLEGAKNSELFGTLGQAADIAPMVFTPDHNLKILKYSSTTHRYTIPVYDGPMGIEVNGSGKLIYGFNWSTASGLGNPAQGNYRLIFTVGSKSLVNLTGLAVAEEDSEEGSTGRTPMFFGNKIMYLDLGIATGVLNPPVPFGSGVKNDFNADGNADVLARDSAGNLWLYPGNGVGKWLPRVKVGVGWNGMTAIVAPGDLNKDYYADVLARDTLGNLWLYPGNGEAGWFPRVKVGVGWKGMTALVGGGDYSGDGIPDLLARDSSGYLWLYRANGSGGWFPRLKVGSGWNGMTAMFGPGDFSGDGNVDLMARDSAGNLWNYPGNGVGKWLARVKVGTGWNGMTALIGPQDWNGDDKVDVISRNRLGQLLLYKGSGTNGWFLPPVVIGSGWNGMTAIVS